MIKINKNNKNNILSNMTINKIVQILVSRVRDEVGEEANSYDIYSAFEKILIDVYHSGGNDLIELMLLDDDASKKIKMIRNKCDETLAKMFHKRAIERITKFGDICTNIYIPKKLRLLANEMKFDFITSDDELIYSLEYQNVKVCYHIYNDCSYFNLYINDINVTIDDILAALNISELEFYIFIGVAFNDDNEKFNWIEILVNKIADIFSSFSDREVYKNFCLFYFGK